MYHQNPADQFMLWDPEAPSAPPPPTCSLPGRDGPSFLYDRGDCAYDADNRETARRKQMELWLRGYRPAGPPRPYRPEPTGTPPVVYEEAEKRKGKGLATRQVLRPNLEFDPDLRTFDKIVVHFSGGKDSMACLLYAIELCRACGVDPSERIEAWHQCVDGNPYPVTITGERAEESANRATYVHREFDDKAGHGQTGRGTGAPRYVERWRAVLNWCELEVWAIIARHQIMPHPAYLLGFGRLSCMMCIFSSKAQLETIRSTSPEGAHRFNTFVRAEQQLLEAQRETGGEGWKDDDYKKVLHTIKSRTEKGKGRPLPLAQFVDEPVPARQQIEPEDAPQGPAPEVTAYHQQRAAAGQAVAYTASVEQPALMQIAMGTELPPDWTPFLTRWQEPTFLPAGAFGEDAGPT